MVLVSDRKTSSCEISITNGFYLFYIVFIYDSVESNDIMVMKTFNISTIKKVIVPPKGKL